MNIADITIMLSKRTYITDVTAEQAECLSKIGLGSIRNIGQQLQIIISHLNIRRIALMHPDVYDDVFEDFNEELYL